MFFSLILFCSERRGRGRKGEKGMGEGRGRKGEKGTGEGEREEGRERDGGGEGGRELHLMNIYIFS